MPRAKWCVIYLTWSSDFCFRTLRASLKPVCLIAKRRTAAACNNVQEMFVVFIGRALFLSATIYVLTKTVRFQKARILLPISPSWAVFPRPTLVNTAAPLAA